MKKVYLVEDNNDNADLIEDMLADSYDLSWFEDGMKLLNHLKDDNPEPPDIFLLDISLPGMGGVELLKHIRKMEKYAERPCMALTAFAMVTDREKLLDSGFDAYMSKPIVDDQELIDEIERLTS